MKAIGKPRIGFLIPRLGITDRGVEILTYELAKRLQEDFDVIIWARKLKQNSSLRTELSKRGVVIKEASCIPEEHFFAQILFSFPFLRKFTEKFHINPSEIEMLSFSISCLPQLLSEKIDLVFPANGIWGSILCRFVRVIKRTPFVYATLGGIEPISARQKPDIYIALFPTVAHWLKTYFPKLNVVFIPSGVDLKKFSPNGERVTIDLPRTIYLTVSALVPEKQVDLTIRAVAKLKKGSLLIIGDGTLRSSLIVLAEKTLGKGRFQFIKVGYSDLPKYYRAADVFAFSAPWEVGWSIVHLEALASGLPVVANKEENLQYLLGKEWPFFCDVSNVDDYSKALARATKGKVDSRKLVKNYSWEKIAKQYKKIFMSIISNEL